MRLLSNPCNFQDLPQGSECMREVHKVPPIHSQFVPQQDKTASCKWLLPSPVPGNATNVKEWMRATALRQIRISTGLIPRGDCSSFEDIFPGPLIFISKKNPALFCSVLHSFLARTKEKLRSKSAAGDDPGQTPANCPQNREDIARKGGIFSEIRMFEMVYVGADQILKKN
jgi:hypothetical protein